MQIDFIHFLFVDKYGQQSFTETIEYLSFFFQSIYKYIDRGNDDSEFIPHIFNATILSYKLKSKQNRSVGNFSNILNTSTHYQYQAEMTNTNIYRIYMFRNVLLFYSLCELV